MSGTLLGLSCAIVFSKAPHAGNGFDPGFEGLGEGDYRAKGAVLCAFALLYRTRAQNENVNKSLSALCPVRSGRDVGNADQSPEQIEWIKVRTDIPIFD